MNIYAKVLTSVGMCLATLLSHTSASNAQQTPVTAIDIALEPDATMVQHAEAVNARLRAVFPKGFSLDATHHPHITMLQRFVRTADLDKIYAAADKVFASYNITSVKLKAYKYYYLTDPLLPRLGLSGIVVETTPELIKLQQDLIDAVAPYTVPTGTAAAFITTPAAPDINDATIHYIDRGICARAFRRAFRAPCYHRACLGRLPEENARQTVRGFHLLSVWSICFSSR